ncbi:MAG: papain-like cysteine protease family protein [Bryobacteraceae bacterium]|nr:papain-like cysteine protease family protein [Bryobacteraceae bacterium]
MLALVVPASQAQTLEPGTGAPNDAIKAQFQSAYSRGPFPSIASTAPQGTVARFGTTGLRQLFTDTTRSTGGTLALVRASTLANTDTTSVEVYQVLTDMYSYYNSVGVATAGYPTMDTQFCPNAACTYQYFDRRYVLFAYTSGANDTQNITTRDPFYTRFELFGGVTAFGPATSAETAVTSSFLSNATYQSFASGILFNITSGALNGRLVSVRKPVYDVYVQRGGASGSLGLPTADVQTLADGRKRQTFEGGSIEYDDSTSPVVRAPVNTITLSPANTPVRLNAGETFSVSATLIGTTGLQLTDRAVNFTTSNSRVVTITGAGLTALVRAVGGGTARIAATSEGKTSLPIDIIVSAVCCSVGEGAPSTAISQAMNDAVSRTRVQLRTPGPERVRRSGSGYVQEFQGVDQVNPVRYLIAMADKSPQAFVISGATLARYEELGASAGALGFPTSDAAASGRQDFERGTLAGTPPRLVTGTILTRWAQSGYESGPAGLPVAEVVQGTSFTASAATSQAFTTGVIVSGPKGTYLIRDRAAEYYLEQGGILSALGLPTGEQPGSGPTFRQEFEGGTLEYSSDATDIKITPRPRTPAISVSPASPLPGSRVRIAVSGFADRANLRVSSTGQADFLVGTANGTYVWDIAIAATAAPGTVTLRATDTSANTSVTATYTIRTLAQARVVLTAISGDTQTGAPGVVLPAPLRVQLRDDTSSPVAGVTVRFTPSPGASVSPATAITDATGLAETALTLPATDGIALATAEAAGRIVTFSARSAGGTVTGFPKLMQSGSDAVGTGTTPISEGGALLASAASILRYLQVHGDLKNPNGMADVATLNEYLRRTCVTDTQGTQVCDGFLTAPESREQIVNLWRLSGFVGGNLEVSPEKSDIETIRSLVAGGSPVLIALSMQNGDTPAGSHFVVATGVAADGSLQIHDPRTAFGRTVLSDYLNGFDAGGLSWRATIGGAVRLLPRVPLSTSFVVTASSPVSIASPSGECGISVEWPDQAAKLDGTASGARMLRMRACSGTASEYQLDIGGTGDFRATVTDLADGGSRSDLAGSGVAAFRVYRPGTWLAISPQETVLDASAVLNSATLTPDIAQGGLISIFGNGLARPGAATTLEIGGRPAIVLAATPFRVDAQVPPEVAAGSTVLRLTSPYGGTEQTIEVRPYAPAVFRTATGRPNIVNANNQANSPQNPVVRGQAIVIYATGLGVTSRSGTLNPTQTPVNVVVSGQELRPSYAGLAPNFTGLYQVNLVIPATFPPGLDQALRLKQGTVESSPVEISIQ